MIQGRGDSRVEEAGRHKLAATFFLNNFQVILPGKRDFSRQQVIKRRSQSIDVTSAVRLAGVKGLLVRHIVRRSETLAGRGEVAGLVGSFGESKVGQLGDS